MKIAILGAGFAGLATASHIIRYTQGACSIDFFDPAPIGGGPSGLSLGLLHPYTGKKAKESWNASHSIEEAHRLITDAAVGLHRSPILNRGIIRPAINPEQIKAFQETAHKHPDTEWLSREQCHTLIPEVEIPHEGGALFIKQGLTIDVKAYLQGLYQKCVPFGTTFKKIVSISEKMLEGYSHILVALGANSLGFGRLAELPMRPIKGEILMLKWPEKLPPPPHSIAGDGHIVMSQDQRHCLVGSTYEKEFTSIEPNPDFARKTIMGKILPFYPHLHDAELISCRAGVRGATATRLPLVGRLNEQIWFMTGLGSKGLLYHAWLGKRMARSMIKNDATFLPKALNYDLDHPST